MSRIVLITGGAGDLARAIHELLERDGWRVYAPGRSELDVADAQSVSAYFHQLPTLDLLINNAGTTADSLMLREDTLARDSVIDVCLRGPFLCSRAALPGMQSAGHGHIVNIGSYAARGVIGQTAYSAAKAGLLGLTKSIAAESGPHGVRANLVLPGWLPSRMTSAVAPAALAAARDAHVLGHFNTTAAVAQFIACLHELTAVSGQVFQLDSRL